MFSRVFLFFTRPYRGGLRCLRRLSLDFQLARVFNQIEDSRIKLKFEVEPSKGNPKGTGAD